MSAFTVTADSKSGRLVLTGALTVLHLDAASDSLRTALRQGKWKTVDIRTLEALDTAGALLLCEIGQYIPIAGATAQQRALLELISGLNISIPKRRRRMPPLRRIAVDTGRYTMELVAEARAVVTFMGQAAVALGHALRRPRQLRLSSISHHVEAIGIDALPIIGLMAFLISVVLAYQGIAQLRPYGGQTFTVDLVAISILREMAVLLTAIMVAGRTGSAFTAEIGVMKAREEVDALQVIGIDPFEMLVVPRLLAIMVALPLLTFFAMMLGLVGGFFIISALIDISLMQYMERVHLAASIDDLFVGMIKAPIFAFFIGLVGCMHGLRVSGSAESIGRETTLSVVKGIFLVLVLDAFFSILFETVGL